MAAPKGFIDDTAPAGFTDDEVDNGGAPAGFIEEGTLPGYIPEDFTAMGVAAEFARRANQGIVKSVDYVTLGAINSVLSQMGSDARLPTFEGMYEGLGQEFHEATGGTGQQQTQFMPSGTARDIVGAAGSSVSMAMGLAPVQRAATTGNYALDFLGLGSTITDDVMREATRQGLKIAKSRTADWHKLGDDFLGTEDDIYDAANLAGKRDVIERNRVFMSEHEGEIAKVIKEQGKKYKEGNVMVTQHDIPESQIRPSLENVQRELKEMYGVSPEETLRVLGKRGGLKVDTDPLALHQVDKQFKPVPMREDVNVGWWEHLTSPMTETLKRHVDPRVAAFWERSVETSTRAQARITAEIGKPILEVAKLADKDMGLKRVLMDFHRQPYEKMKEARQIIDTALGPDAVKSFDVFMSKAGKQSDEARRRLYKADSGFDDIYYLASGKKAKKDKSWVQKAYNSKAVKPASLMNRGRQAAHDMDDLELGEYANPILTHLKHMNDEAPLLEIAKKFGLRPSLGKGGNTEQLFKQVAKKLEHDGIDKERAKLAGKVMLSAHTGSTKIPPALVRAHMALGYAGTLAQLKSSMLNLHDIFVAGVNNGIMPTMKAVFQTTKGQFGGKGLVDMGIGDQHTMGEFMGQFDDVIQNPGFWDKAASKSNWVAQKGFKWSAFAMMDRMGKGVVLRSALNKARSEAKRGNLVGEWGNILSIQELKQVKKYLANGTKMEDMPLHVRGMIEEAAFSKLGEQQLISIAGRPLAYANHTWARPLYAMTGFAIKQKAILRANVTEKMLEANNLRKNGKAYGHKVKEAVSYATRYAAVAGMGYGLLDETRMSLGKDEEFNVSDIPWGVVEQIASVVTLNRIGDTYTWNKMSDDPMAFMLESVLPPMGLTGAAAKTAGALILKGEWNDEIVRKVPALGDFWNYYWFPRKGKAARDKQTKLDDAKAIYDDWGEDENKGLFGDGSIYD